MQTTLEHKRWLMEALSSFLRWEKEGKPKFRKEQYYYDDYHNAITRESETEFSFSIQTYDSPDGDTWWTGRFKTLNDHTDVELIEDGARRT